MQVISFVSSVFCCCQVIFVFPCSGSDQSQIKVLSQLGTWQTVSVSLPVRFHADMLSFLKKDNVK